MAQQSDPGGSGKSDAGSAIAAFISRWYVSGSSERANKDMFLSELCDVLAVQRPNPSTGDPERDLYVFEREAVIQHEGGTLSTGRIDLYKDGCFVLEAKQGSAVGAKKAGSARRETPGWTVSMQAAFGQALSYARTLTNPPPFIIVADIGYCFDLYASFDGSTNYRPFPRPQGHRVFFKDLAGHLHTLRGIWADPLGLDPTRNAARVTREIAVHLADLARSLEVAGHTPEKVAAFLMRALFTMFAEDAGLLPKNLFTKLLEERWVPDPTSFVPEIEHLWQMMRTGGHIVGIGRVRKFNGGFFNESEALPLTKDELRLLLEAGRASWTEVEPAIFGTLLERALVPKDRHALGAHFTPRAYVERLVRPTIEEPLRDEWDLVRAEVHTLVKTEKVAEAQKALKVFHEKLCRVRVLDPACGTGNFLYVALDMLKRLESEVLGLLQDLGETQGLLDLHGVTVSPAQLLGIEINPRAREIAELVLWIGFLRWQYGNLGKGATIPEPVLHDYGNIECRDALLAWDRVEPLKDEKGQAVTRWDGETTKTHPVTGEQVPDETARIPLVRYRGIEKAEWPKADFIVGNPPFLGGWRMRAALGDGYVESLWATSPGMPEKADLVMYWWDKAATLLRAGHLRRFGLITTNSVTQIFQRRVLEAHLSRGVSLLFAIPDHPWVDAADGAAVRIAMTVAAAGEAEGRLLTVTSEATNEQGIAITECRETVGRIHANLTVGADLLRARALRANDGVTSPGVQLYGDGFIVAREVADGWGMEAARARRCGVLRRYTNARDLMQVSRNVEVIDFFGYEEERARLEHPLLFQHILLRVKPERDTNRRSSIRRLWWRFGWERPVLRKQLEGLPRFIVTAETSKHRVFVFADATSLPDNKLTVISMDDAWALGVLSSGAHSRWSLSAGGRLGVGNDPVYNKTRCFDPFPFPACSDAQAAKIRDLGERLDAHRKRQQALHPDLTITGIYNVLEKLRSGEALTAKEKVVHEHGLVSILLQIHDELDAAVFEAYGWPASLTDDAILERLVALNSERAEEERRGVVRWLRPEFQNPAGIGTEVQGEIDVDEGNEQSSAPAPTAPAPWPKALLDRIVLLRDWSLRLRAPIALTDAAQAFVGARPADVEPVLDSLATLGLLRTFDTPTGRRWSASAPPPNVPTSLPGALE